MKHDNDLAPRPLVRVAIVNYRTGKMVIDCLASLQSERHGSADLDVVVVDNSSGDTSAADISLAVSQNGWSDWVRVILLPENLGFAAGNNVVLADDRLPQPDYFWLLNPDTYARPGALEGLLRVIRKIPRAGAVGSCLEWPDGRQQHSAFRFHKIATEFLSGLPAGPLSPFVERLSAAPPPRRQTAQYDWLSGASLLVHRDVVNDIGLMDEGYFLYFEETDFCLRAKKLGWECWLAEDSRVVHLVGQSTGVTTRENRVGRRPAYWFQSRRRYFEKHHGRLYANLTDLALGTNAILTTLVAFVRRRPSGLPDQFLHDLLANGLCRSWRARGSN